MTTTVFFVRHGSHDRLDHVLCGRMPGVVLSERGRAEAQVVAERLRHEGISALYASPLERTLQTAQPIAEALGLDVREAPELLEIDFGAWTGARFADLHGDPAWRLWHTDRGIARPPDGETMLEVQVRLQRWMDGVCAEWPTERIVAVSHGDAIKSVFAHALGMPLDQHRRFEVSPGSVSVLAAGEWGMKVLSINEVPR